MKLFGSYLVEIGLVDQATLLAALVRQLEVVPSVAEIVHEGKLLSVRDQLKIFEHQWQTGAEYRRAALELGLWSGHLDFEIKRALVEKRQPLGQVLVEAGKLSLEDLTSSLDEYVARHSAAKEPAKSTPASSPVAAAEPSAPGLAIKYCALFDEELRFRLDRLIRDVPRSTSDLVSWVDRLRFAARFAGLEASERAWAAVADALANPSGKSLESLLASAWDLRALQVERKAA